MELSESFWITIAGAGVGVFGLVLWYARSILLTSRCETCDLLCGLVKIKNKPINEKNLEKIISHEGSPPQVMSLNGGNSRRDFNLTRISEGGGIRPVQEV